MAGTLVDLAARRVVTARGLAGLRRSLALAGLAVVAWGAGASLVAQQAPATILGSLLNRETQLPIEGARVAVLGSGLSTSSGSDGSFRIAGVVPGVRVLQIRAVGYSVSSWLLQVDEGRTVRHQFAMEPRVYEVAPVTVSAASPPDRVNWRSEAGFEDRRLRNPGYFITREDINSRHAQTLAELLRVVPGVVTTCGYRTCTVTMARSTRQCSPEYFLDGYPASLATGPNFPIDQIRGVEVYRSEFEAPIEFQRAGLRCGVVAIWTVEPGERLNRPRPNAALPRDSAPPRPRDPVPVVDP